MKIIERQIVNHFGVADTDALEIAKDIGDVAGNRAEHELLKHGYTLTTA